MLWFFSLPFQYIIIISSPVSIPPSNCTFSFSSPLSYKHLSFCFSIHHLSHRWPSLLSLVLPGVAAWSPVQLSPSPSLQDKQYLSKKEKKATVKRHSTSYPLSSRYSPILNWICFNSAIFVWLNPPKKKGQQINWQNIPLVSLLIGSTGEPAFLSSAKTIKHAVAGITADTVVVVGCCNSRVFRSSPNFSVLYLLSCSWSCDRRAYTATGASGIINSLRFEFH